ncbi:hypothetical protein ACOBQX_28530 [Actinokineospora sp. G85]|uniref:hypothetical protein n=1 Tax=Actinokineospora sp. G85 TaxID=3406626 RepID=UPI003C792C9F
MLLAALLALAAATTSASASTQRHRNLTLEGSWDAQVTTTIPSSGQVRLTFLADGTLAAPDQGTWRKTSATGFTFTLRYDRFDASGQLIGHTQGTQTGTLCALGGSFVSTGTSSVYNLAGEVERSFGLSIVATRVSR